jgi:hypothetical protein
METKYKDMLKRKEAEMEKKFEAKLATKESFL